MMNYSTGAEMPKSLAREQKHVILWNQINSLYNEIDALDDTLQRICGTASKGPDVEKAMPSPSLSDFLANEVGHVGAMTERLMKIHAQLKEILF